jgi:hypothetical protein
MEDFRERPDYLRIVVRIMGFIALGIFVIAILLGLVIFSSIGTAYVADYGDSVTFDGTGSLYLSTEFHSVNWYGPAIGRACPVVVHLGQQDLAENTFASKNRMRALGARIDQPAQGFASAELEQDGVVIGVFYDNQGQISWLQVRVKMRQDGSWARVPITVNGKNGVLPLKKAELIRVFGKPRSLRPV